MEYNDHFQSSDINYDLRITDEIKGYLFETVKWTRFISITAFVVIGLFFVLLLGYILYFTAFLRTSISAVIPFLINILFIGISIIPIFYLYKFSMNLKKALIIEDQNLLASGFDFLKAHYRFYGIILMIILIIYGILFFFMLFFGGIASLLR